MRIVHPDISEVTRKRNREQKTYPARMSGWCDRCDANYVPAHVRCMVCGFKYTTKHRKK